MDLSGAFVNGLLSIIGYVIIFVGVYKVHQIATDIREIKDLIVTARRNPLGSSPLTPGLTTGLPAGLAPEITKDLMADDSASAYAEHLLRAVNAESHRTESEPHEVR